jgi:uncharacterized protein (DUF58 family)
MGGNRWLVLLVFLLILGLIIRLDPLIVLTVSLFVVLGIAWWWKNLSLNGVIYKRKFHFTRGFPGEKTKFLIEVENRKFLPISWLRSQDSWYKAVGPDHEDILAPSHIPDRGILTNIFSMRWYARARREYQLIFRKRGVYQIGPVRLDSGDLFGFYEKSKETGPLDRLTVFPQLIPEIIDELPAEDPFGDRRSRRRLFEDPNRPMGVRAYHPEDSFRRVHWPATARTGQLQVKVFQPTSGQVMVICMNVATFSRHWEGVYPELLEHMIQMAATLVNQGLQDGYKVGLISNGCLAHADQPFRIPPGRSPQQLINLLEALAAVTPIVTAPFERFLVREAPRIPFGATLVILTATTGTELAQALLQLKKHERKITVFCLADEPFPQIPGIACIQTPFHNNQDRSRSD